MLSSSPFLSPPLQKWFNKEKLITQENHRLLAIPDKCELWNLLVDLLNKLFAGDLFYKTFSYHLVKDGFLLPFIFFRFDFCCVQFPVQFSVKL